MRAQARAAAERVVSSIPVVPAPDPVAPVNPACVLAVRRNDPIHMRDLDVPGQSFCVWHFSQSPACRVIADPLSEEAGGPAPALCVAVPRPSRPQ
eukprot:2446994-Alexandrium_andersonii.AAC.1